MFVLLEITLNVNLNSYAHTLDMFRFNRLFVASSSVATEHSWKIARVITNETEIITNTEPIRIIKNREMFIARTRSLYRRQLTFRNFIFFNLAVFYVTLIARRL